MMNKDVAMANMEQVDCWSYRSNVAGGKNPNYSMRHMNRIMIESMPRSTAVITTNGGWTKSGG